MPFVAVDGLSGSLTATLTSSATEFSANAAFVNRLEQAIANDGEYTFLSLSTKSGGYEIIKVVNVDGEFTIERGQGTTVAINAPANSCLNFEMNSVVVAELIANGGIDPAVCEIVAGDGITLVKDGCVHTLSVAWPTCEAQEFMGATFKVENGCLVVEEPDRCNCDVANGTYENATVTIRDGRICAIQTGANPQYLAPSCTCCNCTNAP